MVGGVKHSGIRAKASKTSPIVKHSATGGVQPSCSHIARKHSAALIGESATWKHSSNVLRISGSPTRSDAVEFEASSNCVSLVAASRAAVSKPALRRIRTVFPWEYALPSSHRERCPDGAEYSYQERSACRSKPRLLDLLPCTRPTAWGGAIVAPDTRQERT